MRSAELLDHDGPFARALPGYERRESQLAMAELVETVLEREGVALIEAGTGTGKTLAYLLPALRSGKRVIVSTGTRALQDQIMDHDLPAIREHVGIDVEVACMKGLSNYLCRRRTARFLSSPAADRPDVASRLPMLREWIASTESGDRAELSSLADDDPLWSAVRSSSETRIGGRCPHHRECFVTSMRSRAHAAHLVVVNHHLFFADLSLRASGASVLPDYDAVIFDEAHQVESVATLFFGAQVSSTGLRALCKDADGALLRGRPYEASADAALSGVAGAASDFFETLPAGGEGRADLAAGSLEDAPSYHRLDAALEALALRLEREAEEAEGSEAMAPLARRVNGMRADLSRVCRGAEGDVTWFERPDRERARVGASPVDVSSLFRGDVVSRVPTVVLTSATLTTSGRFDFIKQRLGIDFEVDEALLPSPFDYAKQAALYLPALPDPRAADYPEAAALEVLRLCGLTGGGAFVLTTSVRRMRALAARCRRGLRGRPIYVQGDAPKRALLRRFREDADAVLFATMSFWEGVDVPGSALRLVILDKLPFDVPSDPLVEARCKRIEEAGEQPFIRYLVPSAALTLKQGFGRLVRTQKDRGIVAVLDSRLRTKGYGKVFLKSLPPALRCDDFASVEAFWQSVQDQGGD